MIITRRQLRRLIREALLFEQDEMVPATHLIKVGKPANPLPNIPNMWSITGVVLDIETGGITSDKDDAMDVRGGASADEVIRKIKPWIDKMKMKYTKAKVDDGGEK